MRHFDEVLDIAAERHGGREATLAKAANDHLVKNAATVPDDRWLSILTQCVFNAGFNWKVIAAKWDGFEAAFDGFDPHRVAFYSDEDLDRLVSDERIVRNGQKIKAAVENARFVVDTAREHGSFGAFLQSWPADDQAGLLDELNKKGSRLGGATAQYFLRFGGWDAWIASKDVCLALQREGVLDKPQATSKGALKKLGAAVNTLHDQSGQPRSVISRVLALSAG
ncbi:MAG: DNA-3-methyladenine glycosylase I [Pseudomonadota bacterium]